MVFALSDHNELIFCEVFGPEISNYENNGENVSKNPDNGFILDKMEKPSLYLEQYHNE